MKTLKVVISAVALSVMALAPLLRAADETTPPANNQRGQRAGRGGRGGAGMLNPEERLSAIDKAVSLTDDQKAKIKDIYAKAQKDVQALPQDERREKGTEILSNVRNDVRALLTDEQKKKFDEMPADGRGGRGGRGGAAAGQRRGKKQ
jgi:protein CpxP